MSSAGRGVGGMSSVGSGVGSGAVRGVVWGQSMRGVGCGSRKKRGWLSGAEHGEVRVGQEQCGSGVGKDVRRCVGTGGHCGRRWWAGSSRKGGVFGGNELWDVRWGAGAVRGVVCVGGRSSLRRLVWGAGASCESSVGGQEALRGCGVGGRSSTERGVGGMSSVDSDVGGRSSAESGVGGRSSAESSVGGRSSAESSVGGRSSAGSGVGGRSSTERGVGGMSSVDSDVGGRSSAESGVGGRSSMERGVGGMSSVGSGVGGRSSVGSGVRGRSGEAGGPMRGLMNQEGRGTGTNVTRRGRGLM
ncbi:hypothetical protein GDO81_024867 [Engystomops pustulosus]|uniref:Uncharacterized protein n=1 Tax=Engystomops pustulosus TaxID=76066 RepID=A0AAV6Z4N7_ENGPU|nr:hypothetical protein GDO81_024867 [Engystomops pustulosus]